MVTLNWSKAAAVDSGLPPAPCIELLQSLGGFVAVYPLLLLQLPWDEEGGRGSTGFSRLQRAGVVVALFPSSLFVLVSGWHSDYVKAPSLPPVTLPGWSCWALISQAAHHRNIHNFIPKFAHTPSLFCPPEGLLETLDSGRS